MLVIFTTDGLEIEWHTEEKIPEMYKGSRYSGLERISYIQADGHELLHIQDAFRDKEWAYTIPMPNRRVCRWYGDLARTIYLNL